MGFKYKTCEFSIHFDKITASPTICMKGCASTCEMSGKKKGKSMHERHVSSSEHLFKCSVLPSPQCTGMQIGRMHDTSYHHCTKNDHLQVLLV
jgi:hypothetical protein